MMYSWKHEADQFRINEGLIKFMRATNNQFSLMMKELIDLKIRVAVLEAEAYNLKRKA
jgi:hypothetical protein